MLHDLAKTDRDVGAVHAAICIIGGGFAGLYAARKLTDAGRRVVVLESGNLRIDQVSPGLNAAERPVDGHRYGAVQVRGLGGASAIWGGCLLPLSSHDFERRDYLGMPGWPIGKADLDPFVAEIEDLFHLDHSPYGPIYPDDDGEADFDPDHPSALGEMVRRWPKFPSMIGKDMTVASRNLIRRDQSCDIWINATVCAFDLDREQGRVVGVEARSQDGSCLTVLADEFILACGTLDSTRLLLLLDRQSDDRVFETCDVLGRYFHDHLRLDIGRIEPGSSAADDPLFTKRLVGGTRRSLHLELSPAAQESNGIPSGYLAERIDDGASPFVAALRRTHIAAASNIERFNVSSATETYLPSLHYRLRREAHRARSVVSYVEARFEQVPKSTSRLTLSDTTDAFGSPVLRMDWDWSAQDIRTVEKIAQIAGRYWADEGLSLTHPVDWTMDQLPSPALEDTAHPAGSARMGVSAQSSVVGPDLRCHALPNLLVASAAVFPSSGAANPTFTVLQLAALAAQSVLRARTVWASGRRPSSDDVDLDERVAGEARDTDAGAGGSAVLREV